MAVATASHVAQTLVTLRTTRRHNQLDGYHLFVCDAGADTCRQISERLGDEYAFVNIFGPDDLGSERARFLAAAAYYDAFEMSCYAKYVGLSYLVRTTSADRFIFADGDLLVLNDLTPILAQIGDHTMLLTPHLLGPTTEAREHGFLRHGFSNGGFFCIRRDGEHTGRILEWLTDRISHRGFHAPHLGLSCDQTWLSALPYVFNERTVISRNPAANVAYWNLEERDLSRRDGRFFASGQPLVFFHFSGFDANQPATLSKYSDVVVEPGSPLAELWQMYKQEVDATAPLATRFAGLDTIPLSKAPLAERILAGSVRNNINIASPYTRQGLFSRIGQKIDLALTRRGR
jgi:hypothetical protein